MFKHFIYYTLLSCVTYSLIIVHNYTITFCVIFTVYVSWSSLRCVLSLCTTVKLGKVVVFTQTTTYKPVLYRCTTTYKHVIRIHNYRILIVCICVFTCRPHIVLPWKGSVPHDDTFITERKLVRSHTGRYVCSITLKTVDKRTIFWDT